MGQLFVVSCRGRGHLESKPYMSPLRAKSSGCRTMLGTEKWDPYPENYPTGVSGFIGFVRGFHEVVGSLIGCI